MTMAKVAYIVHMQANEVASTAKTGSTMFYAYPSCLAEEP